jgi:NNP family nitrate/nitrite transporter-like MFS transporter
VNVDDRIHRVLCGVDHFFDHRDSRTKRKPWSQRDRVRPSVGTPILTDSLIRLMLGIWTDQHGERLVYTLVMFSAAVATWLLTYAYDYPTFFLAALGVGIAGGSFAVGIAYVSRWYPNDKQGTVLGIFGVGNVGAAVTKFLVPFVLVAYGPSKL